MARVQETKANVLHLPDTSCIDDLEIRKAIDALSQVVRRIWEADHSEEFYQLISSRRFEKVFFNIISSYVKKYFSEEEVVKNIDFEDPTLRFVFKKHLLLSAGIPGNRELEIELPEPVEVVEESYSSYFKLTSNEGTLTVVNGILPSSENCGHISTGEEMQAVAKTSMTISEDSYIVLNLHRGIISAQPMTNSKIFGLLLGRAYYSSENGTVTLTLIQDHSGLAYKNIPQAFDIVVTGDDTISVQGGSFIIDNVLKTLVTTPLTVSSTGEVYITATVDITPSAAIGTVPSYSPTIAYEPLGNVYFSGGKITNIEQYKRGWFHCHTWGNCEASNSSSAT